VGPRSRRLDQSPAVWLGGGDALDDADGAAAALDDADGAAAALDDADGVAVAAGVGEGSGVKVMAGVVSAETSGVGSSPLSIALGFAMGPAAWSRVIPDWLAPAAPNPPKATAAATAAIPRTSRLACSGLLSRHATRS
jgi:hypothetical protein